MFERGSEWRRWDLHLHTPGTKKNDNYEGKDIEEKWNKFYAKIDGYYNKDDERKNVAVIGITDYLSIENYVRVLKENRLSKNIVGILPNVEMRITPMGTNSPVNIHFIFNPDIVDELETRFFGKLQFQNINRSYCAQKYDLISLGKALSDDVIDDEKAYIKGLNSFVPSYDCINKIFLDDKDLRENTLIGVANKSTDGASGIDRGENGDQLTASKLAIYKMCDFIFSSNQGDIDYFLGRKCDAEDVVIKKNGSLKPCFHGSDAHSLENVFEPTNEKYCWIKADPTFNGLKQVIYEPYDRVRIQGSKPDKKADYQVIDKVFIKETEFSKEPILFNDKLTCIIGGKSTGKSLLLQNMAKAVDQDQVEEKLGISGGKSKNINNIEVHWKDGEISVGGQYDFSHKIIYLPQTYLNRLTDIDGETTEIDKIIQEIVLLNADCKESFDAMEESISKLKPNIDKNIYDLLQIAQDKMNYLESKKEIGTESGIQKEIEKLRVQKEAVSKDVSITEDELKKYEEALNQLSENTSKLHELERDIVRLKRTEVPIKAQSLDEEISEEVRETIKRFQDEMIQKVERKWDQEKASILLGLENKKEEINNKLKHNATVKEVLEPKIHESESLAMLSEQIKEEEKKLKEVKGINEKYEAKEIEYSKKIKELVSNFCEYDNIRGKYAEIVNNNTDINGEGLEFRIRILHKGDAFCEMLKTKINNASLKKQNIDFESFDESMLKEKFLFRLIDSIISEKLKLLKNQTKENIIREILSDWSYVSYNVNMENDEIGSMSPGKKALVLLKLLISLADSKCPILIDQPEDDLDNRSIFEDLIPFIKEKKVVRQIIIVTHNANVVLGGDAEEIIVANQSGSNSPNKEYRFEYMSGSIENDIAPVNKDSSLKGVLNNKGIQQHICDILEGGERAFDLRKHKYRI